MPRIRRTAFLAASVMGAALTVTMAGSTENGETANACFIYTGALKQNEAGVVAVPSRFQWSVETSWRGLDAQGNDLPDTRVMLRLYDPDHNFTALTAQMDLETADRLQRDLATLIAKKRQQPDFQHRPKLYDSSLIPTGKLKGVRKNGEAIIELAPRQAK